MSNFFSTFVLLSYALDSFDIDGNKRQNATNNQISVVSMGGCSLALTMILYLTESLYYRSSTLTFYVIFPCVLNCEFIIFLTRFANKQFSSFFATSDKHMAAVCSWSASHLFLFFSFHFFMNRIYYDVVWFPISIFSNHVDWPYLYPEATATMGSTYR